MLGHYLTVAYRDILRQPVATLIGVLTLSLGLVCVVTAYAIVAYLKQSDSQFANADRTYVITANMSFDEGGIRTGTIPVTNWLYADYVIADVPELEAVARSVGAQDVSISTGDRGLRVFRMIVDPEFTEIFDLPFTAGDPRSALSRPLSVVLREDIARNLFDDADPMGQGLVLANQIDVTVTGVFERIPEPSHLKEVEFFASWDIWDAIQRARGNPGFESPDIPENWFGGYCCTTYALLPADGSITEAGLLERLSGFASRRLTDEELSRATLEVGAVPLAGLALTTVNMVLFGPAGAYVSIATVLFVLGGLVLAVACVNYANLATARAVGRARDIGLRKVVGAHRRQIAVQYLAESTLLVAAAVAIAIVGFYLLIPALRSALEIDLASTDLLSSPWSYLYTVCLLAGVAVLAGGYPALVLSGTRPIEALRIGRVKAGPKRMSTILVGTQFFAASFLLIVLIVMYAQNLELRRNGLGAQTDPLLVIDNASGLTGVTDETLRTELMRIPQVQAVTSAAQAPWDAGINLATFSRSSEPGAVGHSVFSNSVGYDFFAVLEIPLIAGRVFDRAQGGDVAPRFQDRDPSREIAIVLDRTFVEQLGFASPEAAVGEIIYMPTGPGPEGEPAQRMRIIGVVENKPLHLYGIGVSGNSFVLELEHEYQIARIAGDDVSGALAAIDAMWSRLSPSMPRSRRFLDEVFEQTYQAFGRMNQLFTVLALMAFFISIVGLLGMAMQIASRRRHEIGIRKTLGATTRQIVEMLVRSFSKPVVIANLVAWPLGFLAANVYLTVFMHRIPLTPMPFILSLLITILVAWATIAGQALKAARARPAEALGCE